MMALSVPRLRTADIIMPRLHLGVTIVMVAAGELMRSAWGVTDTVSFTSRIIAVSSQRSATVAPTGGFQCSLECFNITTVKGGFWHSQPSKKHGFMTLGCRRRYLIVDAGKMVSIGQVKRADTHEGVELT